MNLGTITPRGASGVSSFELTPDAPRGVIVPRFMGCHSKYKKKEAKGSPLRFLFSS